MIKRIGKFFSSMPFAITLLVLLAGACALSSTVSQGQAYEYYAAQYGERTAGLIIALRMDDAFHSWWFIGLSAFLCLNLLCCNLIRLPALIRRIRAFADPGGTAALNGSAEARGTGDPGKVFFSCGCRNRQREERRKERNGFSPPGTGPVSGARGSATWAFCC